MLIDAAGMLAGLFTDSDLARLFESRRDAALDHPIREVMTCAPTTVPQGSMMSTRSLSWQNGKSASCRSSIGGGIPVGLIDITDVVAVFSRQPAPGQRVRSPLGPMPAGRSFAGRAAARSVRPMRTASASRGQA